MRESGRGNQKRMKRQKETDRGKQKEMYEERKTEGDGETGETGALCHFLYNEKSNGIFTFFSPDCDWR